MEKRKLKTYTKATEYPLLVIEHDEWAENPREWDNLGYLITIEDRRHSPNKHEELERIVKETGQEASNVTEHMDVIKKNFTGEKIIAIYPIYRYEHSGVAYHLGTAHGFDYSNCGFYIITDKTQKNLGTPKKSFEKVIKQELQTYNSWVNGETYRFTLYDKDGEIEDSCGGYYDIEHIKEALPKEWAKENLLDYLK